MLFSVTAWGDGWKVGASRVVITPDQPLWMAGYGSRDKPAEGTESDLWAKSLVLEDAAGHRAVLVTLDLVGIDRTVELRVAEELRQKYGIQREQLAICTSHTHCGPAVGRNLGPLHYYLVEREQQRRIDQYTSQLEAKIVAVVGEAVAALAPSQLSWGSGRATYAVNRRENTEAKVLDLRNAGELKGPYDHDVPVLAARKPDGSLTAVLFGYACHATVLSFYRWCGDHPGFAQTTLESNHPGCVALFWAGCGADQNPLPRRTVELARHYGQRLATAVDEVLLTTKMREIPPELITTFREIDLPLGPLPSRESIAEEARSNNPFVVSRARQLLEQLDAGRPLAASYPYPVGVWQLGGEIQFVTLGGEVVVDYALRLKAELRGPKTWVAGYSHDVMAYIPSRRVLQEGGYEGGGAMVYYGLPTVWAPEVEETIVRAVHAQVGDSSP
jgi:hypothetical protein